MQSWAGVATGSITAPDHEYPAYLELQLTVEDSGGLTATASLRLDPRTVALTLNASPGGISLTFNGTSQSVPFTRTVIRGSTNTITAPSPQTKGKKQWIFRSWSDGGAATHNITAPATPTTYTATFKQN